MRPGQILALLLVVSPAVSFAQSRTPDLSVTTPAPVPGNLPTHVTPANRVAGAGPGGQSYAAGPAAGTPFSNAPVGTQPSDALSGPHSRLYPAAGAVDTPNLSR